MRPDESRWPKSPRSGKPVDDLGVLRRRPDRLKKPQLPTGNRAGTVSGFQMRQETSLRRFAPQLCSAGGNVITLECSPKPKHSSADSKPPATAFVAITTQSTIPVVPSSSPLPTPAARPSQCRDLNGDEAAALNQLAHRLGLETDPN